MQLHREVKRHINPSQVFRDRFSTTPKRTFVFLDGAVESFLLNDEKQNVFNRIEQRRTPFRDSTGKDCGEGATPVGW